MRINTEDDKIKNDEIEKILEQSKILSIDFEKNEIHLLLPTNAQKSISFDLEFDLEES